MTYILNENNDEGKEEECHHIKWILFYNILSLHQQFNIKNENNIILIKKDENKKNGHSTSAPICSVKEIYIYIFCWNNNNIIEKRI